MNFGLVRLLFMDANFWAIIGVGVVLLGAILTGQRSLRNEISDLRRGLEDLRGQLHDGLSAVRKEMNDGLSAVRKEVNDGLSAARKEMDDGLNSVRKEVNDGLSAVRKEMNDGFTDLRDKLADVRERLGVIEGALSIRQVPDNPESQPRRTTGKDRTAPSAQP